MAFRESLSFSIYLCQLRQPPLLPISITFCCVLFVRNTHKNCTNHIKNDGGSAEKSKGVSTFPDPKEKEGPGRGCARRASRVSGSPPSPVSTRGIKKNARRIHCIGENHGQFWNSICRVAGLVGTGTRRGKVMRV
eukprot:TRINITY_DN10424_c5_g1_i1.p2 TRINITY_DN10424_c5_g1~~TRINITY_DN10424_c5_g1_i1.p2  ORF type:complete len:135 (-),score=1.95 TRINITY_DN10424_c5_g1_i1:916-1320(-)